MERVLSERHKRAEGARQEAEASRAAVQEKLRAYNEAMRKVRGEMFIDKDIARRRVLDERQADISAARTAEQHHLQAAKQSLAADVAAVRVQLEQSSGVLANEIADAILAGASSGSGGGTSEEAR